MNNEALIINALEMVTCSRCCGSGHYSYNAMTGTRCFKCHGKKEVLTKRGSLTNQFIKSLRSSEVSNADLKVGDWIKPCGESQFFEIISISEPTSYSKYKDFKASEIAGHDVWIPVFSVSVEMKGLKAVHSLHLCSKSDRHHGLDALATWKQGMEFQASLSKAGKPTKKTSPEGIAFFNSIEK
jgi:hypothetical protein